MKKYTCRLSVLLLITVMAAVACRRDEPFTSTRLMMGSLVNITIMAPTEKDAALASSKAFDAIARLEELMSPKRGGSDVARVNRFAGAGPVAVSEDTFFVISQSKDVSSTTEGAFDVSFAALSPLWNYSGEPFTPPSKESVAALLPLVDYRNIVLDGTKRTVRFARPGMRIGLGGIAQGYGVRKAMEVLAASGVQNAIVDVSGDLQVMGTRNGEHWRVGLMHPREKEIILSIEAMPGDAIQTSGDYERFAMHNGVRYHHILDPGTGFPSRGLISVTVVCRDPMEADAYGTALFVMGKEKAIRFLGSHGNLGAILIDESMKLYASRSLRRRIEPAGPLAIEWF